MTHPISGRVWSILACGACGQALRKTDHGAECTGCGQVYGYSDSGLPDLRLKIRKKLNLEFEVGPPAAPVNALEFEPLPAKSHPEVDFTGVRVPWHLTREMMSYFPRAGSPDSLMLDLGCGNSIHKGVCEHAGFEWVGLDYGCPEAMMMGDAHALPFQNEAFEFILSIAVLEHLQYPFVAMREAYRVLKPGGWFIGTVAFLEPFHENSFYHHTHLGTLNSLRYAGFTVEKCAPNDKWSGVMAQATMGLFPRMPTFLARSLVYPVQILHDCWLRAGDRLTRKPFRNTHLTATTGSFTFIARKRED